MHVAGYLVLLGAMLGACQGADNSQHTESHQNKKMVIGYFPNWLYNNFPVSSIPFEKYTHINYAFALQNNEDGIPHFEDDWAVEHYLPQLVMSAHDAGTKVLLSIGGWTGSKRFSSMAASKAKRQQFIDWNLDFIEEYDMDGVDIDWEYPGRQAAGCNEFDEKDTDHLQLLLKELRAAMDERFDDKHKLISMAVYVLPFERKNQTTPDVSDLVPYFDFINLMTYDINGAWADVTGPNAPFEADGKLGADFSFVDSIHAWKKAGVPSAKINAGLAFYGRSIKAVNDMTASPSEQFQPAQIGAPKGDKDDSYWANPFCSQDIDGVSGVWKWANLRSEGLVLDNKVTAGKGWVRYWDDKSKTPWLFNPQTKVYISYDDPISLAYKVKYAMCEGLAGVMVWDIHQDNQELVDVIHRIHEQNDGQCVPQLSVGDDAVPVTPTTGTQRNVIKEEPPVLDDTVVEVVDGASSAWSSSNVMHSGNTNIAVDVSTTTVAVLMHPHATLPVVEPTPQSGGNAKVEDIEPAGTCRINGAQRCTQAGITSEWLTCANFKWVARQCADGLVCHNAEQGILCDYPKQKAKAQVKLDGFAGHHPLLAVEPIMGDNV